MWDKICKAVLLFVWFNPEQVSVLAILWMISVINVTKFIDGLDGLRLLE